MMRSAKCVVSATAEPPNPRLITCRFGKSAARFVHIRMLELPTNNTAPLGGGLVRSRASNVVISRSHLAKFGSAADASTDIAITAKSELTLRADLFGIAEPPDIPFF